MRRLSARLLCFVAFGTIIAFAYGAEPSTPSGRHFYVDTAGSDAASGRTPAEAWRTVARVNDAHLQPGDAVSFRAGQKFSDSPLMPRTSGARGARIVYDSFGGGSAILRKGVVVDSVAWITIARLRIRGTAEGVGSGGGSGARHIDIIGNWISYVERGINSPNSADQDWLIADNVIQHTGDSGVIVQGSSFSIVRNVIRDTGRDESITYGKHGIYSKSLHVRIYDNSISDFANEGISTRFPDAQIIDNVIRGGDSGVGYYRDASAPGAVTTICGNTISAVHEGVYIGPEGRGGATDEHFRVLNNIVLAMTGRGVNAPADSGKVQLAGNTFRHAGRGDRPRKPAAPCPRKS
jgi:hypothetical protein